MLGLVAVHGRFIFIGAINLLENVILPKTNVSVPLFIISEFFVRFTFNERNGYLTEKQNIFN